MKKGQKQYEVWGGFHNQMEPIRVWADPDLVEANGFLCALSDKTADRVRRHMCGHDGCLCDVHHGWEIEEV